MIEQESGKYNRFSTDVVPVNNKLVQHQDLQKMKVNSLCIALFLSLQLLNYFLNINTIVACVGILTISILNNRKVFINKKGLLFFLFVLIWFGVSTVFFNVGEDTFIYFVFFLAYGGTALYLCDKSYTLKKVLHYLCIIHVLVSPFVLISAITEGSTMGETYSFLIGIFALILCIFTKRFRVAPLYIIILLSTSMIYIYKLSLVSTRGVYLSIIIFLILYYLVTKANVTWKTILYLLLIAILAFGSYIYMYEIFVMIDSFLSKLNLDIKAISKSIRLLEAESFDHNRNWFYDYATEGIKEHWLVGQGIGAFEYQTGRVYIHNVILQILFEGGILYFLPYILILLKLFKWLMPVKEKLKNEQIFIILLTSSSLVKLMFSYTYLKEQTFLLLLMLLLTRKTK